MLDLTMTNAGFVQSLGFTAKRYPADTIVFSQGDHKDRIYIVESGWGQISHELQGGQRQIVDFALTGDVVLPQSNGVGAVETFVAQTELSLLIASYKTFVLAAMKSPDLFSFIVNALVRNGAVRAQHLVNVGRRSALARTSHLLLELTARLQQVGAVEHDSFECPLTQHDLADALGLTPIHVNRMLRELRERKFLEFRQGNVHLLDWKGLTEFAGFEGDYIKR
jgi:CRP-like cAMP-binding protein